MGKDDADHKPVKPSARNAALRMQCMEVWGGVSAVDKAVAMPGLDAWVYGRPYSGAAAGGDVHYVSSCATGRITRLLVADVSGHGADVSVAAEALRGLMRKYVNYLDQRRFFRAMNEKFASLHSAGGFATAVVTTFFAPTDTLSVSNAGHPPPLWWHDKQSRWTFLMASDNDADRAGLTNLPLGVIDATRYDRFDVSLKPGDRVLCYTDSLSEARDASGELLSMNGLLEVANTIDGRDAPHIIPAFVAAVGGLYAGNLAGDDLTLLCFAPTGEARDVPTRDRLLAPLRVARGLLAAGRGRSPAPWPEVSVANLGGALIGGLGRRWHARQPKPGGAARYNS